MDIQAEQDRKEHAKAAKSQGGHQQCPFDFLADQESTHRKQQRGETRRHKLLEHTIAEPKGKKKEQKKDALVEELAHRFMDPGEAQEFEQLVAEGQEAEVQEHADNGSSESSEEDSDGESIPSLLVSSSSEEESSQGSSEGAPVPPVPGSNVHFPGKSSTAGGFDDIWCKSTNAGANKGSSTEKFPPLVHDTDGGCPGSNCGGFDDIWGKKPTCTGTFDRTWAVKGKQGDPKALQKKSSGSASSSHDNPAPAPPQPKPGNPSTPGLPKGFSLDFAAEDIDLEKVLEKFGLTMQGKNICQSGIPVGYIRDDQSGIRAFCKLHGSACKMWISVNSKRPRMPVLQTAHEWLAAGACQDDSGHLALARQMKVAWGMKPRD